jgi:PAS domain S-box-containing protein
MSPIFPDSLETPSGVLAATQATLLGTCKELSNTRTQLAQELAEKERLRRELRLRDAALDAGSSHFMLISTCDPLHPIVYVNRTLARDYGFEPQELIGQSITTLKVKDPADPRLPQLTERLRRGETIRDDLEVLRRDGTSFCAGFTITPLRNRLQQITHFVVVGADITARKEAERKREQLQEQLYNEMHERERISSELRLAQKLEAVGRLAGGIAHDFNNLATVMLGFCDVAMHKIPAESDIYDDLLQIRDAAERAAALIQQLLAFSRKQILHQRKAITARSGGSSGARSSSMPCGRQVMLRLRPSACVSSSSCV